MQKPTRYMLFVSLAAVVSAANAQDVNSNESTNTASDAKAAVEYWTEEAMEKAIPFPEPEVSEEELKALQEFKPEEEIKEIPGAEVEILGTPSRANVSASPYNKGGKLFFTLNGTNYSCSAQFVGSTTVLMTAAHCVRATSGAWATNVLFRRAYSNGGGQNVGTSCLSTKQGWVTGGNGRYKWDYAFIKTSGSSGAGNMGLRTGISDSQFQAIGYPANYGSNQYMYQVNGSKGTVSGGVVEMKGNPMRSGNSGGAWLAGSTAIGLNSFHKTNNSTDEWGPYFDSNTVNLYQYASNGCR